jgi:RNA recognition motif-containing protein
MNLYVGNLSFDATKEELSSLFAQCGTVTSANIITDRATGRSKGFAFVEMSQASEAQAAISKLNGFEFKGRKLTVNEARPKSDRPQRSRPH